MIGIRSVEGGRTPSRRHGDTVIGRLPTTGERWRRAWVSVIGALVALTVVGVLPIGNRATTLRIGNSAAIPADGTYFRTLPPGAELPDGAQCAALIPTTPETIPANAPSNHTMVTQAQLAAFAANGYSFEALSSKAQYGRITGDYSGSTDMIMRWAACKYGIDEKRRARAGVGREAGGGNRAPAIGAVRNRQCVQGDFRALWDTSIPLVDGTSVACPRCCWTSWSAWQTKVYYEWIAWPMIKDSTSFAAEYRYASARACINGDWSSYYASRRAFAGHNTYAGDLANHVHDPSAENLDTLLWGCIGSHYSGEWYDAGATKYIADIQADIARRRWLTPQIHVTGGP